MIHLIERVTKRLPTWNKVVHGVPEAENYCDKFTVGTITTDIIDDLGEYRMYKNTPMIFLHKFMERSYIPWVFWHEIGHDILHSPLSCKFSKKTRNKIEKEANIIAAVALIPLWVLQTKHAWEIHDEYGYPMELIWLRKYIGDNNKI